MNSLNSCSFIGNISREVETRYMPNGDACASFSIGVNSSWKDKATGEKKQSTEWVRCIAWRELAEICAEYLKNGQQVYVSGAMKTRMWEKDGIERYTTEIVLDRMQMLGSRGKDAGGAPPPSSREDASAARAPTGGGSISDMTDDIPFISCALGDDVIVRKLRCTLT